MRNLQAKTIVLCVWCGTIALGVAATAFWLSRLQGLRWVQEHLPAIAAAVALAVSMTLLNIGLRWARWHFLTRRVGIRFATRDCLLLYTATLPGIMTPFSLGELIRAVLLGKKYSRHRPDVVILWFLERSTDLFVLAVFVGIAGSRPWFLAIFGLFWLLVLGAISALYRHRTFRSFTSPWPCTILLLTTTIAWLIPGLTLLVVLRLLGEPLGFASALATFSHSTILGGLMGLPLGTGVTGSSMIAQLQAQGLQSTTTIVGAAIFRLGTAWFSVALGVAVAVRYRGWLLSMFRSQEEHDHFDQIADGYEEQIPDHVRRRLLERKIRTMQRWLGNGHGGGRRRGLDLGCGQGWYATKMAELGHEVFAVDLSQEQVQRARRYAQEQGTPVQLAAASATRLPFPDASFDFVYAINMIHHVTPKAAQRELFAEVARVLKPEGVFFLHEINITNPLFRLYMSYLFPLIRTIDEGTESWIRPQRLPAISGAGWKKPIDYFTFLPDFLPAALMRPLAGFERLLERSRWRSWSAHYVARLVKES